MHRLRDKVALITGAGRGIGAAIADAFVDEGARVFLADLDVAAGAAKAAQFAPRGPWRMRARAMWRIRARCTRRWPRRKRR